MQRPKPREVCLALEVWELDHGAISGLVGRLAGEGEVADVNGQDPRVELLLDGV